MYDPTAAESAIVANSDQESEPLLHKPSTPSGVRRHRLSAGYGSLLDSPVGGNDKTRHFLPLNIASVDGGSPLNRQESVLRVCGGL